MEHEEDRGLHVGGGGAMDVKFRPHQDVEFQQMVFILLSSLYDVI